ncbi:hypothetical protein OEA41_010636 [Lepraria neglecta]|uniref:Uncharacterized protein n=1 Tax=Lepraria neglecta TaxID=209136 RepID=A0AAD9YWZ5_9LECA|nr:hypothetical protein OEA41_010636 [Lepraria neglecta]
MIHSAEFYRTYAKALTEVGDKSSETRQEFENLGLMALLSVGRDFRTLVNIWLLKGVCELIEDNIINPLKNGEELAPIWIKTYELTQETTRLVELMGYADVEGIRRSSSPVTVSSARGTALSSPDHLNSKGRGVIEEIGKDGTTADRELDDPDITGQDCTAGEREDAYIAG